MAEWSTAGVDARERFSYWREAVCQSIFNLAIEAPSGPFSARLTARSAGPVRIALGESTRYDAIRGKREVANDDGSDHYSIYLQLRSETVISQGDQTFTFQPYDIGISALRYPFHASLADGGRRITTVIPCAMIDRRAPWLRNVVLHRLTANSSYVDLARRHIVTMIESEAMSESATALLTENICNLLALASAADIAPSRLQPELQTEAMLAFCRQHLHEAEFTPQHVADHLGVSVRTVQLRFKRIGSSFSQWMLVERLNACRLALRDRGQGGLNISEIAYRWGFNDLSYFNRSFRAHFDATPSDWRNSTDETSD
jgi:AraC family transcriptional activator of tynA and feaB